MGGVLVGYLINPPSTEVTSRPERGPGDTTPRVDPTLPDTPVREEQRPVPDEEGRVAIVIDDVGWSRDAAPVFAEVREHLTFALLPERPYSRDLYDRWKDSSRFLVHMPMEPEGYPEDDPGEMALMTSMSTEDVQGRLNRVLDRYPQIAGINNHMGSEFTANRELMAAVMDVLAQRGLFYLDSRTSPESVAVDEAHRRGVRVTRNQVFLDNERSESAVRSQLEKLVSIAREEGTAIGIGHFQSMETARVLRREIPRYRDEGIVFVGVNEVIEPRGSSGDPRSRNTGEEPSGSNRL